MEIIVKEMNDITFSQLLSDVLTSPEVQKLANDAKDAQMNGKGHIIEVPQMVKDLINEYKRCRYDSPLSSD